MPTRPCRGTPERKPTTIGTSSASRLRSRSARIAILRERELVSATSREASTTSANRVKPGHVSTRTRPRLKQSRSPVDPQLVVVGKYWILGAVCAALALGGGLAPGASAAVVHSRTGQFIGVAPRPGVAIAGSPSATHATGVASASSVWTNLSYQGRPVLHSSDPYLIFWATGGEK